MVQQMSDFRFHLIEESQIGSEVVGADEENILSWSSDQKWKGSAGKKQGKSFLIQHLEHKNLVMYSFCQRLSATKCTSS